MQNRLRHSGLGMGSALTAASTSRSWTPQKTPSNLAVTVIGDTDVTVTWDDAVIATDGLKLYTSTDAGVTYKYNCTVAYGLETAILSTLQRGTSYTIKLVAYKGSSESDPVTTTTNTLAWYDDFESNTNAYFSLGAEVVVIDQIEAWNPNGTHTATVVDTGVGGLGGYRYWMWWCCPEFEGIGLARSNALNSGWIQYVGNPVLPNMRSANAYIEDGVIYIFYDVSPSTNTYVKLTTTTDGLTLTEGVTYVTQEVGYFNTDSFFFKDPNTGLYHLYWNRYDVAKTIREVWCKTATTMTGLITATPALVFDHTAVFAKSQYFVAFSVIYRDGKYWLSGETSYNWVAGEAWAIYSLFSDDPLTGWQMSSDSPYLKDGRACPVQHIFDDQLYLYISYKVAHPDWDTRLLISDFTKNLGVQWLKTLPNADSDISYSTTQKTSGTKSVKIYSGTTANATTFINKYWRATYNSIKYYIYITALNEAGSMNAIVDILLLGTRVFAIQFAAGTSDKWRYNDGTTWTASAVSATVGWHLIEITFAGAVSLSIDGSVINANVRAQTTWDEVKIQAVRGSTSAKVTTIYVDDFKVLKV